MSQVLDNYLEKLNEDEPLQEIEPTTLTLGAIGMAFSISNMAFRAYKDYFNKAARRCKDMPPREKSICMMKAKLEAKKEELSEIKRKLSECAKTNDPNKCRTKLGEKVKKITDQVNFFTGRLRQLMKMKYD